LFMNLDRFHQAQSGVIDLVLGDLRAGKKRSHWMWFIFPQVVGLGSSELARRYAIGSLEEARAYLADPVLGGRLRLCAELLLGVEGKSALEIMGSPDDLKLRSSMTLFAYVASGSEPFVAVIGRYFEGSPDPLTLEVIDGWRVSS
jgi:uncharacterized protein (DUF1810 family)